MVQGKDALVRNFERMRLCSPLGEYLPVWFEPARDGFNYKLSSMKLHTIGEVISRRIRQQLNLTVGKFLKYVAAGEDDEASQDAWFDEELGRFVALGIIHNLYGQTRWCDLPFSFFSNVIIYLLLLYYKSLPYFTSVKSPYMSRYFLLLLLPPLS